MRPRLRECFSHFLIAAFWALVCFAPDTLAEHHPDARLRLQLHWLHQFEFAGYYAALEQGYYRQAGLTVEILPAGPGIVAVDEVASGRAEFGVANAELVLARLRGQPVVALAPVFQHSASVLLTRADSNLHTLHDLIGRRIELGTLASDAEIYTVLRSEGVAPFEAQPTSYSVENLLAGRTDAVSAYKTNQPFALKQRGVPYRMLRPTSYGVDFYGDTLFTSETMVRHHPEQVAAFRQASLRGWAYAFENPERMFDLILGRYAGDTGLSRDKLRFEFEQMQALVMPELVEFGHSNPKRWVRMAQVFTDLGLAKGSLDPGQFLFSDRSTGFDWQHRYVHLGVGVGLALGVVSLFLFQFNRRLRNEVAHRWQVEEQLLESERRLSMALDGANLGCWDWRLDIDEVYIDERAAELLEYEAGAGSFSIYDEHACGRLFRQLRGRFEAGKLDIERQVGERWILFKGKQLGHQNLRNRAMGTLTDNTQTHDYQDKLEMLSITDPLTGLLNRRYFRERLEQSWAQHRREGRDLALALLDIDHFKQTNDRYGHQVGDRALVCFARELVRCCRPYDLIARYGGEEFIILFSGMDKHQAAAVMERYRTDLAGIVVEGTEDLHCRFSGGVADSREIVDDSALEQFIKLADQRLYAAKHAGRDRVQVEGEPGSSLQSQAEAD